MVNAAMGAMNFCSEVYQRMSFFLKEDSGGVLPLYPCVLCACASRQAGASWCCDDGKGEMVTYFDGEVG